MHSDGHVISHEHSGSGSGNGAHDDVQELALVISTHSVASCWHVVGPVMLTAPVPHAGFGFGRSWHTMLQAHGAYTGGAVSDTVEVQDPPP